MMGAASGCACATLSRRLQHLHHPLVLAAKGSRDERHCERHKAVRRKLEPAEQVHRARPRRQPVRQFDADHAKKIRTERHRLLEIQLGWVNQSGHDAVAYPEGARFDIGRAGGDWAVQNAGRAMEGGRPRQPPVVIAQIGKKREDALGARTNTRLKAQFDQVGLPGGLPGSMVAPPGLERQCTACRSELCVTTMTQAGASLAETHKQPETRPC